MKALITGITGQDGSYLAEFLLSQGYEVHGLIRRSIEHNIDNIKHIKDKIIFHFGDLTDSDSLQNILLTIAPDEVYNLAAQSHVRLSFDSPILTTEVNALGPLKLLNAIKVVKPDTKFYQASTSELFGEVKEQPQNEFTEFNPVSPYSIAKLFAHYTVINYRESYNIFACNGILYNHESPRRGELFVTRKITKGFANIVKGSQKALELGNLDSLRDWGHAKDYVRAMWLMLQQDKPKDYVVSSQEQHSVRDLCNLCAEYYNIELEWRGERLDEVGVNKNTGETIIRINPYFFRPVDVVNLLGDSRKARRELSWTPQYSFKELIWEMCSHDEKNS